MKDAILEWRSLNYYSIHKGLISFHKVAKPKPQIFMFSIKPSVPAILIQHNHPLRTFLFFGS